MILEVYPAVKHTAFGNFDRLVFDVQIVDGQRREICGISVDLD